MKDILKVFGLILIIFASVFTSGIAYADLIGDPILVLPNDSTRDPIEYDSPRIFSPTYRFSGGYYDPTYGTDGGNVNVPDAGITISSSDPALIDTGYDDGQTKSWVQMYANAGTFDAKIYNYASVDGNRAYGSPENPDGHNYNAFVNTGAGVGNWYVLTGTDAPVSLVVDILFQGTIYADYETDIHCTSAFFSHSMGFLSSEEDLTQDYIMAFGGAVTPNEGNNWDYTKFATVPLLYWEPGSEEHEINNIIRSQVFTVTPGEPFRLNLALNAAAYANNNFGAGTAYTNFYDPSLVDFSVYVGIDNDGNPIYGKLSDMGYSVSTAPIPEPATLILLGSGLLGLFGFWKKGRPGERR